MKTVTIYPEKISPYGKADAADNFCLLTNSEYVESFIISENNSYKNRLIIAFDGDTPFEELLKDNVVPDSCHILTILPNCLLHSVDKRLLNKRKLLIMACKSGKTSLEGIEHFLRIGERTDPNQQLEFSDAFFQKGESSSEFKLINPQMGLECTFDHLDDQLEWHEQLGELSWGDQQVFPSGEIACFLVPLKIEQLDSAIKFKLNGKIALKGNVIVQSGPPSFLESDQQRIFEEISTIEHSEVVLDIKDGQITHIQAMSEESLPAAKMLSALFTVDSRFRNIYEVGFSINTEATSWPGNSAMNEICGGDSGRIHLGLGMLPHTQYHLDIFCDGTIVKNENDELLFGKIETSESNESKKMVRHRSVSCPCIEI
ncbi:hypothetical protein [Sessilibacter corallicola]|uniref:Crocagin biosynthetic protein CgnE/B domain-containing protein n=1 Tax=Sessilibacter corallicola TaxID=2904075 RepID=A0ABQ0A4Q5_9GAMM